MTSRLDFAPAARAKRGTGPRTSRQVLRRRRRSELRRLEEQTLARRRANGAGK